MGADQTEAFLLAQWLEGFRVEPLLRFVLERALYFGIFDL